MTKDKIEWKNWTERDKHFFDIGKLSQKKEDIEMIEKKLEKLKEWADKNTGCGGDTPYGELLDEIDKIFGEEIK